MDPLIRTVDLNCGRGFSSILSGVNLDIYPGKIVGLIGPNGAGKTTLLRALAGFGASKGELTVLGQDPRLVGEMLFRNVFFIPDCSSLPRWMKVGDLFGYIEGVHEDFDIVKATNGLALTGIDLRAIIGKLSKGMKAQLYSLIAASMDVRLLILDEPTLGLDLIFRKRLYSDLVNEYIGSNRSVVISTHEIVEIEDVLTDVIFMNEGKILLSCSMKYLENQFLELDVKSDQISSALALPHVNSRACPGGRRILYKGIDRKKLNNFGLIRTPSLADIFLALLSENASSE